jgi:type VI secretion system protein ImpL
MIATTALLSPWFSTLLPVIAVVLAVLLLLSTVAAIRQFRGAEPGPRPSPPGAVAAPSSGVDTAQTAIAAARRVAAWLAALTGNRRGIDGIPLLVAIGAGSADVQRMIPNAGPGAGDLARAQRDLFRGDCRLSVCPDGAVVSFEDGLLGSDRREERWTALVGGLLRSRPHRPFDGLVIILTADSIFGPRRRLDDDLVMMGEQLYQLIWMAQRAAGWRIPIYLIISGCECLTGFAATVEALPEPPSPLRDSPLGWRVPYALASAFERSWIREGIDGLVARLSILQSSLLMRSATTEDAEQLLLFPGAVAALAEPLSTLLTPMLRPSAYHEAFMFRGFYLAGQTDAVAATSQDAFTARLFPDRFFPEHVLAQPAQGAMTRRHRHIRIAQGALAFAVLLALIGVSQVRRNFDAVSTVRPLVEQIASLAERLRATTRRPGAGGGLALAALTQQVAARDTQGLLLAMSGVSLNQLETGWAPLSYATDANATLQRAIRAAYTIAVLREVRGRLRDQVATLLGADSTIATPAVHADDEAACEAHGATSADVERLQQVMQRLSQYGLQLRNYQDLTVNPQIANLKSLLQFALSVELPAGFSSNHDLYLEALNGAVAPPLLMGAIRGKVTDVLRPQFIRAFDAAYPGSQIGLAVDAVVSNADTQPAASPQGIPQTSTVKRLQRLSAALHAIQAQASLPENAWLHDGTAIASIASGVDRAEELSTSGTGEDLAPVDNSLPLELRRGAAGCLTRTRQHLMGARVFDGVPVLAQNADALSSPLLSVMPALDGFLAQPVATVDLPPLVTGPTTGGPQLFWGPDDLQSLQRLTEAYLLFDAQNLPLSLPAAFRQQVKSAAGERLDVLVAEAIAHARRRGSDRRPSNQSGNAAVLHDEIARFSGAAPVLANLSAALRTAGRTTTAENLDQLLSDQAIRLLRQVDALLIQADPYQLVDRTLSFWSGNPPIAAAAFGAATLPELVGTLPARRDFAEALARDHAAPLVSWLQRATVLSSGASITVLNRWQGIIDTLDRYHRGDPANSLSRLEQFISADMDRIDPATCGQVVTATARGTDWFAVQLDNIRTAVAGRCGKATASDAVAQYDDLSATFNRDLAGRFPFGPVAAPDVDPDDVKRFYGRFGADLATLQTRLGGIGSYARAGAAHFVAQLAAVADALAPMLSDPAPNAPLTYAVDVEFRTNIGSDPGANQVAEATVEFGQQRLSSFATAKSSAWSNGQPVEVQLRWAENAPSIPVAVGESPVRVRGLVVSYEFAGTWALLRMMAAQTPAAGVLAQISDRRPGTVGFTVPLQRNPNAVSGGDSGLTVAQLFMRLGLTGIVRVPGQPDRHPALLLPVFPVAAPQPGRAVPGPGTPSNRPIVLSR